MERRVWAAVILVLLVIAASALYYTSRHGSSTRTEQARTGEVVVCTAGSMALPLKDIMGGFSNETGIKVLLKPKGSVELIREFIGLKSRCDVIVVADYRLIPMMLYPNYTRWYAVFASNELVVAWGNHTKPPGGLQEILARWIRGEASYGFSDPNRDPCGYRAVGAIALLSVEEHNYSILEDLVVKRIPGSRYEVGPNGTVEVYIPASYTPKPPLVIRPKSIELLSLLESGELDYAILYRSEAVEQHLHYVPLPPGADLGDPRLAGAYSRVVVHILSGTPSEKTITMAPIAYGLTIPSNAPNEEGALLFVKYLLQHLPQLEEYGFKPLSPPIGYGKIPAGLEGLLSGGGS